MVAALGLVLGTAGCSTKFYERSADREAYRTLAEKTPQVPNMDPHFTIEQTNVLSLEGLPELTSKEPAMGADADAEMGARILTLEQSLAIGVKHSRRYQDSKEQLFLQALSLTLARHQYRPLFYARGQGRYAVTTSEVRSQVDALEDATSATDEATTRIVESRQLSANGVIGADWLLRTGARLSTAFTADFLRILSSGPQSVISSDLGATLIQPLWQGAGYKVTMENLIQAERDLLYQLRQFVLFRREFSVQVASSYYNVLRDRDALRNNYRGLLSSRKSAERTRAYAQEAKTTQAELGRMEQQELSTESGWINAIRNYQLALDQFKILIGLSTDARIVLDDRELQKLQIVHPDLAGDEAVKVGLATRLDLASVRDQVADAERKVVVAANGLRPKIDFVASGGLSSPKENSGFPLPDVDRYRYQAGLDLDLGLDRKGERNIYRRSLIAFEQARRQYALREDEIKLQIRESWRNLDQAKRNYEISLIGVRLSERRVEEQELLAELGRGRAQDLVDAQNDLTSSKNELTQALVGHTVSRLQFWNNMGILLIKDDGLWTEAKVKETHHENTQP
jgi:outer membrane protein TolC